jgi:hypothetical protein
MSDIYIYIYNSQVGAVGCTACLPGGLYEDRLSPDGVVLTCFTGQVHSLFGWLVADGWCWFVLRKEYCWLVLAGCWWLVCSERKVLLAGG